MKVAEEEFVNLVGSVQRFYRNVIIVKHVSGVVILLVQGIQGYKKATEVALYLQFNLDEDPIMVDKKYKEKLQVRIGMCQGRMTRKEILFQYGAGGLDRRRYDYDGEPVQIANSLSVRVANPGEIAMAQLSDYNLYLKRSRKKYDTKFKDYIKVLVKKGYSVMIKDYRPRCKEDKQSFFYQCLNTSQLGGVKGVVVYVIAV